MRQTKYTIFSNTIQAQPFHNSEKYVQWFWGEDSTTKVKAGCFKVKLTDSISKKHSCLTIHSAILQTYYKQEIKNK